MPVRASARMRRRCSDESKRNNRFAQTAPAAGCRRLCAASDLLAAPLRIGGGNHHERLRTGQEPGGGRFPVGRTVSPGRRIGGTAGGLRRIPGRKTQCQGRAGVDCDRCGGVCRPGHRDVCYQGRSGPERAAASGISGEKFQRGLLAGAGCGPGGTVLRHGSHQGFCRIHCAVCDERDLAVPHFVDSADLPAW